MGHQEWLERPYAARADMDALFEQYCENQGLEFDDPVAGDAFEAFLDDLAEGDV